MHKYTRKIPKYTEQQICENTKALLLKNFQFANSALYI